MTEQIVPVRFTLIDSGCFVDPGNPIPPADAAEEPPAVRPSAYAIHIVAARPTPLTLSLLVSGVVLLALYFI